ncbi:transcriptional repressor, partial [Desulfovibrio sp. OttesenSCG-928-M14]|nr:transcriptional repressor [Desulfovibrio sp. OttesenSCG-928-M14]
HHDHLICNVCGKNVEIMDEKIEQRQEQVAREHGFLLLSHRMILHGICSDCRSKGKKAKKGVGI